MYGDKYEVHPFVVDRVRCWAVIKIGILVDDDTPRKETIEFTGTILECEAWLRLKDGGYL